jgi:hypothetical protein
MDNTGSTHQNVFRIQSVGKSCTDYHWIGPGDFTPANYPGIQLVRPYISAVAIRVRKRGRAGVQCNWRNRSEER